MTNYRRNRIPGGTYFLTINLLDRRSRLLVDHIEIIREATRQVRRARPFHINACVVLPDHMHCLWTLPEQDMDYSTRVRLIKTAVSKAVALDEKRSPSRAAHKERGIWQRRFWEHTIRDDRDYAAHMDYIHFNPVHHGLTDTAAEWPYSTFKSCVARCIYPPDWLESAPNQLEAGERECI